MFSQSVLLVEDDKEILRIFKYILQRLFHSVYTATNGLEALTVMKDIKIDIVITDYNMPKMDGLELTKKIKKEFPKIPVVMVSGEDTSETILSLVDGFVKKPMNKDCLINTLKSVLKVDNYDSE
jgi:CheY-like chemotaxis protein